MEARGQLSESKTPRKLSIAAQFDDLCRFSNYMMSSNEELGDFYLDNKNLTHLLLTEALQELLINNEVNRKEWLSTKEELVELKEENRELKSTLNQIKKELRKSDQKNKSLKNMSHKLILKLDSIKDFLQNDVCFCRCDPNKEKLFSYFDYNIIEEEEEEEKEVEYKCEEEYSSLDDQSLWDE